MSYQPKINPEAVRLGYLRINPSVAGLTEGYQTRITPPTPQQMQKDKHGRRPNPYVK